MSRTAPDEATVPEPPNSHCWACGDEVQSPIYRASALPVHSCVLSPERETALAWSRADLELHVCHQCGFIANTLFDPALMNYSASYEDQQSYSPTFNQFSSALAASLFEKYRLRGKTVLEIGCGKADFLRALCEMGITRGIGIDPSVNVERTLVAASGKVELIAEPYSDAHGGIDADFILCRHTLEHIQDVAGLLGTLRVALADRVDVGVFFEVPDTTRILGETAFEDIYYEHCSYFTPGSLARLFRQCGFAIVDLYRGYDDQYLMIEAHPIAATSTSVHPLEETRAETSRLANQFRKSAASVISAWQARLSRSSGAPLGNRCAIWGSGSKCVSFLSTLGGAERFPWVVDINPRREGKYLPGLGLQIRSPESLVEYQPDYVLVMNPVYRNEIEQQLGALGLSPTFETLG